MGVRVPPFAPVTGVLDPRALQLDEERMKIDASHRRWLAISIVVAVVAAAVYVPYSRNPTEGPRGGFLKTRFLKHEVPYRSILFECAGKRSIQDLVFEYKE